MDCQGGRGYYSDDSDVGNGDMLYVVDKNGNAV